MAVGHFAFDRNLPHGQKLNRALNLLEDGLDTLNEVFEIMNQMKDGGAITSYLQQKFGFPDVTTAEAAYNELNSLQSKLNTNASVTDVNAAMIQCFRKFG